MSDRRDIRRLAVVLGLCLGVQLVGEVAVHAAHADAAPACVACHLAKATAFPPTVAPAAPPQPIAARVVSPPARRPTGTPRGPARDRGPPPVRRDGHASIHANAPPTTSHGGSIACTV